MSVKLIVLVILQAALTVIAKPYYDVENYEAMGQQFEEFIRTYSREYSNDEKTVRFNIFIENVKEINELNKMYNLTTFGINNFADMSKEEKSKFLGVPPSGTLNPFGDCDVDIVSSTKDSPAAWDWRAKGAVSPVKNQKDCVSGWAFSTTGMLESKYWRQGKQLLLSEQQLVDCDITSTGCEGGLMSWALTSIMNKGLMSENDYPYEDTDEGNCRFDKTKVAANVTSCTCYSLDSEDALQDLLYKEGPLTIFIDARGWAAYKNGIYENCNALVLYHGVLLVGYGTENGVDYWVLKNSYDSSWGENGFIRIKKGVGCCGIFNQYSFLTVSAVVA